MCTYIHIKGTLLSGMLWIIFFNSLNKYLFMVFFEWPFSAHSSSVKSFRLLKTNLGTYTSSLEYWAYCGLTHSQASLTKKQNMSNSNSGVPTKYSHVESVEEGIKKNHIIIEWFALEGDLERIIICSWVNPGKLQFWRLLLKFMLMYDFQWSLSMYRVLLWVSQTNTLFPEELFI